jgi:hypothetical protein
MFRSGFLELVGWNFNFFGMLTLLNQKNYNFLSLQTDRVGLEHGSKNNTTSDQANSGE